MWTPSFLTRWFESTWRTCLVAASEALAPGGAATPCHRATALAPRTEAYIVGLPPTQSVLLKLLFVGVEWLTPLLAPIGGRFSRRTPEGRVAVVEGWRGSWVFPVRLLGDAVRATLMMVYFSHPDVLLALGEGEPGTTLAEAG